MRGFVLAAGVGFRLGRLGEAVPKPLLPLGGAPLIRFALEKLRRAGVREAGINLHHRAGEIRAALGPRAFGVELRYFEEPLLLGTAGGLKNAEAFLREGGEPFFVVNADAPCAADLGALWAHHRRGGHLATLLLRRSPEAGRYGLLGVDASGRLRRFLDARAPGRAEGEVAEAMFTGVSVLSPGFLDHIPAGRPCSIAEEVYPPLLEGGAPLGAVLTEAYWADAGTPARFLDASADLLAGRFVPEFPWPVAGDLLVEGPAVAFGEGTLTPPVLVGEGVRLGRGSAAGPFTVLMRDANLAPGARAEGAVLLPRARVAENATIRRCVLGPDAQAGPAGGVFEESVFLAGAKRPLPLEVPRDGTA